MHDPRNGTMVSRTLGAVRVHPPDTSIIGDRPIFFPRLLLSTYQEKGSTSKQVLYYVSLYIYYGHPKFPESQSVRKIALQGGPFPRKPRLG